MRSYYTRTAVVLGEAKFTAIHVALRYLIKFHDWDRVKTKFERMKGVHETMLPSYLDEFSVAGTSWKYSFHSSSKSVSGHCSQVPRLGFRVAPSAVVSSPDPTLLRGETVW